MAISSEMQEFIDSLELPIEGEEQGKQYVIEIPNSDTFSQIFDVVDTNKDLQLKGESKATDKESMFRFTDGTFDVVLSADYDNDLYSLVVEVE